MKFEVKHIGSPVDILYGKKEGSLSFDAVMVLETKDDCTEVHGFVSRQCNNPKHCEYRESMTAFELVKMWKALKEQCKTRFIEFDVLMDHSRIYKQVFHVESCYVTKTFDGHEAEHLRVDMNKGLKHFNNGATA